MSTFWTVRYFRGGVSNFHATFNNIDLMLDSCVRAKAAGFKVNRWVAK